MNILHINSYYFTNKIHLNFKKHISDYNRDDYYFVPVYRGAKQIFEDNNIDVFDIYRSYDKLFFFTKIFKSVKILTNKRFSRGFSLLHAHTLISDGLIAWTLKGIYKTNYVVTIRNTDLNFFLPNRLFKFLGAKILQRSALIICLSPAYRNRLVQIYPFLENTKIRVLPNGLDNFWLDNKFFEKKSTVPHIVKLLFVGRIDSNKNVNLLLEFIQKYSDRQYHLTVVGDNQLEIDFSQIDNSLNNGNSLKYLEPVYDKNELLKIYREHDLFTMVSFNESFGVSYLEAMSQGLPVLFSKNEGIDGFFEEKAVGMACLPDSVESIKEGVDFILSKYDQLVTNTINEVDRFSWERVAANYHDYVSKI
jgi:glycosyltransferase involved in cell wall biosynthesis